MGPLFLPINETDELAIVMVVKWWKTGIADIYKYFACIAMYLLYKQTISILLIPYHRCLHFENFVLSLSL